MEKKRVSVQIEGRSYAVITFEERSYVHSVADEVIRAIRRAAQTGRHLDTRDCAIMAAMDFCDDRNKAERRNKDVIDKADQIIRQSVQGIQGAPCRRHQRKHNTHKTHQDAGGSASHPDEGERKAEKGRNKGA